MNSDEFRHFALFFFDGRGGGHRLCRSKTGRVATAAVGMNQGLGVDEGGGVDHGWTDGRRLGRRRRILLHRRIG